ncbi:uncharacterized protein TRIVIDRAFT_221882 [Trichoderma virens Gv29-8]|uniref:Uncharacterized protein n=1 Tax=Hypocrea virens (strain Gv29-8 / FGSC 10586) TaxID=413071 RepID=G9MR89_HYPVG|nr:uncharacterized protein TRIVIDRAFT_221882 [Trichoderma virens Gv29-8]EHK22613.1 hypothetical protein TRIVIDRAFT_221882 [Trichoderma virens Gv29-8]UKZ47663.1 hypothetical protein TrVGV298_001887 [Trichoderma virens]UKZ74224.1 hypothetical protein TrVFT333_001884 [Trichoderma virens FT-333]
MDDESDYDESDYDIEDLLEDLRRLPRELHHLALDIIDRLEEVIIRYVEEVIARNAPNVMLDLDMFLDHRPCYAPYSWGFPQNHRARTASRYQYIRQPPARRNTA